MQATVAEGATRHPYWSNVGLYGEFVVGRLSSKMRSVLLLKNSKNHRLKLASYVELRALVRMSDFFCIV